MIRNEKNHVFIDHFLEELESYGLEIGIKLEQLESEKQDYLFFVDVLDQINKSKVGFCSSYFALSEDEKALVKKKFVTLFKDSGIVDSILQEMINLYYLQERGLLKQEEVLPQKEVAMENIETLATKISKHLKDIPYDLIVMNHDKYSKQMDGLMYLGDVLEEDGTFVEDIDLLKDTLKQLKLTREDKNQILFEIIKYNGSIYQEHMRDLKKSLSPKKKKEQRFILQNDIRTTPKGLDEMLGEITS